MLGFFLVRVTSFGDFSFSCLPVLDYRIMHYSKNGIWDLREVDVDSIKPKAPTGAWGVEMEAIRYLVSRAGISLL